MTIKGDGLGGRNQEFVLAAAIDIAGLPETVVLSAGTDGSDGPTDAAGAIADGETLPAQSRCARISRPQRFLPLLRIAGRSGDHRADQHQRHGRADRSGGAGKVSFWRKQVIQPALDHETRKHIDEQRAWIAREPGNARPY